MKILNENLLILIIPNENEFCVFVGFSLPLLCVYLISQIFVFFQLSIRLYCMCILNIKDCPLFVCMCCVWKVQWIYGKDDMLVWFEWSAWRKYNQFLCTFSTVFSVALATCIPLFFAHTRTFTGSAGHLCAMENAFQLISKMESCATHFPFCSTWRPVQYASISTHSKTFKAEPVSRIVAGRIYSTKSIWKTEVLPVYPFRCCPRFFPFSARVFPRQRQHCSIHAHT